MIGSSTSARGQGKAQAPPEFPVGLDVVNLTVAVRDERGHLVSDLGPDDLVVKENGRPQTLSHFARTVQPGQEEMMALDLGLLLDTSESMIHELKLSQEAAVRFLEAIPRARELFVIFFDHDIRISRYDSESQQGLIERIENMKGGGSTALYDAIAAYLSRVEDSAGRKVLVLFTDGEDSTSQLTLAELTRLVRSSRVTIYPIALLAGFSRGSTSAAMSKAFLGQLAEMTGGTVFTPSASKDLSGIYQKILEELSTQYVVGFVSDNPKRDGKFRKLEVEVKRKGLKAQCRTGYYAAAGPAR